MERELRKKVEFIYDFCNTKPTIINGNIQHKAPFGYKCVNKKLVPDESTKDQIIKIFNLYYEGNSYQTISNLYNKEKVFGKTNWCDATIHFDESSPNLHIVDVPFKDGAKNGMEKQVGKSDAFTTDSLRNIQDKMREHCINSFNITYNLTK